MVVQYRGKRGLDVVGALILLLLSAPLFVLAAIVLKLLHWEVPLVVGVEVLGQDRRVFRMFKFSTMVRDAHQQLAHVLGADPAARQEWERDRKLRHDPRILPLIGNFLRRTSINELPQLINVLKGEMSLVGPRPITVQEEELYVRYSGPLRLARRHAVRPGITGLWQVAGRANLGYAARIGLDASYLAKPGLGRDLAILLRTAPAVIKCNGAY
ncbi:MAG TPA: sugar transferase [Candidatus Binataceae bacterium]|nr:sugar transferase [Candidatus Binataceae bacterium]